MNKVQLQRIRNDLKERWYILIKVEEQSRNPSRAKKIKKLLKKIKEVRGESIQERVLLLFELEKEMGEDRVNRG